MTLTAEERDALETVLAVVRNAARSEFAPYMDGDQVDAFLGALAVVDPPLTVRPATDPAGLTTTLIDALVATIRRDDLCDDTDGEHHTDEFVTAFLLSLDAELRARAALWS